MEKGLWLIAGLAGFDDEDADNGTARDRSAGGVRSFATASVRTLDPDDDRLMVSRLLH